MTKPTKPRPSTLLWQWSARMVGVMVAPAWVVPALWYNIDWSATAELEHNIFAGSMVVASAVAVEASRWVHGWHLKLAAYVVATILAYSNLQNAIDNLARMADGRADLRRSEMVDASKRSSERSEWSAKVDAAKKIVGVKAHSSYSAEADAYKVANSKRWNDTDGCSVERVTSSKDFCAEFARLKGLADTAKARDDAQAEIRKIDDATRGVVVATNADPYAAYVAMMFGVKGDAGQQLAIRAHREVVRALGLEAMATFMPAIWLALVEAMIRGASMPRAPTPAAATRPKTRPQPEAVAAPAAPDGKATAEFLRFCADALEEGTTYTIDATPAYRLDQDWRKARGLPPISQRRFGQMMGERFRKDDNNGYPRYLGVRAREKPVKLAVVGGKEGRIS